MRTPLQWSLLTVLPLAAGLLVSALKVELSSKAKPVRQHSEPASAAAPITSSALPLERPVSIEQLSQTADPFARSQNLWAILARSSSDELQKIFEETAYWDQGRSATREVRAEVVRRWLEIDPQHVLAFAGSLGTGRLESEFDRLLFSTWGRLDPGAALAAADSLGPSRRRQALLTAAIEIAEIDPEYVLNHALEDPDFHPKGVRAAFKPGHGRSLQDPIEVALRKLAQIDTERAIYWLSQLAADRQLATASNVGFHFAKSDPVAALAWADSIEDTSVRTETRNSILRSLYLESEEGALERIANLEAPSRDAIIKRILDHHLSMDQEQVVALLPLLSSAAKSGSEGVRLAKKIGGRLGAELALGLAGDYQRDALRIVSRWAEHDPDDALTWGNSLDPASPMTASLRTRVLTGIADRDHLRAIQILESDDFVLTESDRNRILASIATRYAESDPLAAFDWANSLENAERQTTMERAIYTYWTSDRNGATALVEAEAPGDLRDAMARRVIQAWSGYTGEERLATEWLWNLVDPPEDVVASFFERWMNSDPAVASGALVELPTGSERDTAIRVLIKEIASQDIEAALLWAGEISNERRRRKMMNYLDHLQNPPPFTGPW